jgi:hypothetical protein
MSWRDLIALWGQIRDGHTPDWHEGKALEHLVIRALKLSKLEADYPYDVPPRGRAFEQIDGIVHLNCHTFLIECKDQEPLDIEAIAKVRNQLLRRLDTTFGCVFTAGRFTTAALILADILVPHPVVVGDRDRELPE